jgi:hypothetical protein
MSALLLKRRRAQHCRRPLGERKPRPFSERGVGSGASEVESPPDPLSGPSPKRTRYRRSLATGEEPIRDIQHVNRYYQLRNLRSNRDYLVVSARCNLAWGFPLGSTQLNW